MVTAGADQTVNQGSPVTAAATFSDAGFEAGATAANYARHDRLGRRHDHPGHREYHPGRRPRRTDLGTVSGSHYYADEGIYPVTVSVADDGGGVGQGSFKATSIPLLPPWPRFRAATTFRASF